MRRLLCLLGLHPWMRAETNNRQAPPGRSGTIREEYRFCPHCHRGEVRSLQTCGLWDLSQYAWVECQNAWEARELARKKQP